MKANIRHRFDLLGFMMAPLPRRPRAIQEGRRRCRRLPI
jgi:hypothetical protein